MPARRSKRRAEAFVVAGSGAWQDRRVNHAAHPNGEGRDSPRECPQDPYVDWREDDREPTNPPSTH